MDDIYIIVKGRKYKYNDSEQLLELIWDLDGKEIVVDYIGLSRENWYEDKMYWVEKYNRELDDELANLI